MDYEKKYKEALERAKDFYKGYKQRDNQLYADDLETIFPELRESEDEQIRKEIEQLIQCMHDADPRKERWIAWLEKQKEYESTDFEYVWDRTDCGDLTSALDKYSEEAIINMCHAWYDKGIELERKSWLEKQGGQKSVDKEYTFKSIPRLLDMIEPTDRAKSYCKKLIDSLQTEGYSVDAKIVGECLKQMNGEKVAMAVMDNEKQDEKKSQRMVSAEAKEALYDKPTDEEMKELLRTEYEKGRADTIAEMKLSWSEEDEKMLEGIVNTVKDVRCQSLLSEIEIYDDYIDWLESIKQRIGG